MEERSACVVDVKTMHEWMGDGRQWTWDRNGGKQDYGCENVAAGTSVTHAKNLCMLCQAGPMDKCDQFGRLLAVRGKPAHAEAGGRTSQMLWHLGHQVSDVHRRQ